MSSGWGQNCAETAIKTKISDTLSMFSADLVFFIDFHRDFYRACGRILHCRRWLESRSCVVSTSISELELSCKKERYRFLAVHREIVVKWKEKRFSISNLFWGWARGKTIKNEFFFCWYRFIWLPQELQPHLHSLSRKKYRKINKSHKYPLANTQPLLNQEGKVSTVQKIRRWGIFSIVHRKCVCVLCEKKRESKSACERGNREKNRNPKQD